MSATSTESTPRGGRTAVVTGATGFVGRHLVRALDRDGWAVHAVARAGSTRRPALPGSVAVHELDNTNLEIADLISSVRPTVVFHLATLFMAQHRPEHVASMVEANVTFGALVAEAATQVGARLVHATSAWQHFEGAAYSPVSLYAATKQALCDVIAFYVEVEGLDAREVCLFDTYGPDDDRNKLVSVLLDRAFSGAPLPLSSGRQLIDLTHIRDVADAFVVAADSESRLGRLVARTGRPTTVRALVSLVESVTGRHVDAQWDARSDRPREMLSDWRIPSSPHDWRPSTTLRDGLAELWQEKVAPS